jgi:hypothetical protein
VLSIGTVEEGEEPDATLTGEFPDQVLNLVLPRGDAGPQGEPGTPGATGPANTLTVGTVTTGAAGSSVSVSITGTAPNQTLSLTIPRGNTGATGDPGPTGLTGPAAALTWTFDPDVTDADPGPGDFRINNGVYASASHLYIDDTAYGGGTVTGWLDSLDDSTNPGNRGRLTLIRIDDPTVYAIYDITGAVVDGTGYRKVPVVHISSNGTLSGRTAIDFSAAGKKGEDGGGSGNVVSDGTGVDATIPIWDADGYNLTNSGVLLSTIQSDIAGKAAASHTHTIANVTGLQDALDGKAASTHAHAASDVTSGVLALARLPVADSGESTATELVRADDARLANARTPTAHTHPAADISDASANSRAIITAATYAAIKTLLGLENVDNTTDLAKPVSTAVQSELDDLSAAIALKLTPVYATATDIWAGTDTDKIVTADAIKDAQVFVAIAFGATITPDLNTGINFTVGALTSNFTLANPTNLKAGWSGSIRVAQGATPRTIAYGTAWKPVGGTALALSTTANHIDYIDYQVAPDGASVVYAIRKNCGA